jgi:hypothetical protein
VPWIENLLRDARFGLRMLAKSPGFTAVALLTLMLGIGSSTAMFSLLDGLLLRPLPAPHAEQLVAPWRRSGMNDPASGLRPVRQPALARG